MDARERMLERIDARLDELEFVAQMVSGAGQEGWYQRRVKELSKLHARLEKELLEARK